MGSKCRCQYTIVPGPSVMGFLTSMDTLLYAFGVVFTTPFSERRSQEFQGAEEAVDQQTMIPQKLLTGKLGGNERKRKGTRCRPRLVSTFWFMVKTLQTPPIGFPPTPQKRHYFVDILVFNHWHHLASIPKYIYIYKYGFACWGYDPISVIDMRFITMTSFFFQKGSYVHTAIEDWKCLERWLGKT